MTRAQQLSVRLSEIRQRLNELAAIDTELTDEQRADVDRLTREYRDAETQYRAATIAESADGGETEERETIQHRARVGEFMRCAVEGAEPGGAEHELQAAHNLSGRAMPWAALDPGSRGSTEERADTATTVPANAEVQADEILGRVFSRSAGMFLGVRMPMVDRGERNYPVLTAGTTAAAKAKGATHDATAATFKLNTLAPIRVTGRYRFRREDAAAFPGLEESLRQDLRMELADALDRLALQGSTTPSIKGFFTADTDPDPDYDAPAAAFEGTGLISFTNAIKLVSGQIDGTYAGGTMDVRLLTGPKIADLLERTVATTNTATPTAGSYLRQLTGGMMASGNVSDSLIYDTSGNAFSYTEALATGDFPAEDLLTFRGPPGAAVQPVWEGIDLIVDEVTAAADGEIILTAIALANFAIIRHAQYSWKRLTTGAAAS